MRKLYRTWCQCWPRRRPARITPGTPAPTRGREHSYTFSGEILTEWPRVYSKYFPHINRLWIFKWGWKVSEFILQVYHPCRVAESWRRRIRGRFGRRTGTRHGSVQSPTEPVPPGRGCDHGPWGSKSKRFLHLLALVTQNNTKKRLETISLDSTLTKMYLFVGWVGHRGASLLTTTPEECGENLWKKSARNQ